jgi:hypothetical protein
VFQGARSVGKYAWVVNANPDAIDRGGVNPEKYGHLRNST